MKKRRGVVNKGARGARRKFARKLVGVILIIIVLLLVGRAIFYILEKFVGPEEEQRLRGELPSFGVYLFEEGSITIPENCSDESLKGVWNEIFIESPDTSVILKNSSYTGEGCPVYYIYKTKNNEEAWILYDMALSLYFLGDWRLLGAYYFNATPDFINNMTSHSFEDFYYFISSLNETRMINLAKNRSIQNESVADQEFENKYQIIPEIWEYSTELGEEVYFFNNTNEIDENLAEIGAGVIFENKSIDKYVYIAISVENITIPFTFMQIGIIGNKTLYKNENSLGVFDLDDYFICSKEVNYSVIESPDNGRIRIMIDNSSKRVDVYPEIEWSGTQKFNLTASCGGQVLSFENLGENMTFKIIILNETNPSGSQNRKPRFLNSVCGYFSFYSNRNFTIDMDECFEDDDGDELTFKYDNMNISEISIERTGNDLKFIPSKDFVGQGYFYMYADDSTNETKSDKIIVRVVEGINITNTTNVTQNDTQNTSTLIVPSIVSSTTGSSFQLFTESSKSFAVVAENYDTIDWYLNDRLVKVNSDFYIVSNLSEGDYTLKAEVKKGSEAVSRLWYFNVARREVPNKAPLMFFIIICGVLGLLILLISLLIIKNIMEKKEQGKSIPIIQKTRKILRKYPQLSRGFGR